jgi:hypothetical protein
MRRVDCERKPDDRSLEDRPSVEEPCCGPRCEGRKFDRSPSAWRPPKDRADELPLMEPRSKFRIARLAAAESLPRPNDGRDCGEYERLIEGPPPLRLNDRPPPPPPLNERAPLPPPPLKLRMLRPPPPPENDRPPLNPRALPPELNDRPPPPRLKDRPPPPPPPPPLNEDRPPPPPPPPRPPRPPRSAKASGAINENTTAAMMKNRGLNNERNIGGHLSRQVRRHPRRHAADLKPNNAADASCCGPSTPGGSNSEVAGPPPASNMLS